MTTPLTIIGHSFGSVAEDVKVFLYPAQGSLPKTIALDTTTDTVAHGDVKAVASNGEAIYVDILKMYDDHLGYLQAEIFVKGVSSGLKVVGLIASRHPIIIGTNVQISPSSGGNRIEIVGESFGNTCNELVVSLQPAIEVQNSGAPVNCTDTLLIVETADSLLSTSTGLLQAVVTRFSWGHSSSTTIGKFSSVIAAPSLISATAAVNVTHPMITVSVSDASKLGHSASDIRAYWRIPGQSTIYRARTTAVQPTTGEVTLELQQYRDIYKSYTGSIECALMVNGQSDGQWVTVAFATTVQPVINTTAYKVAQSLSGNILKVLGKQFATQQSFDSVISLKAGTSWVSSTTIVEYTNTQLIVSVADTNSAPVGPLYARVSTGLSGNSGYVQVGEITSSITSPAVSESHIIIPTRTSSLVIQGNHFGSSLNDIQVQISPKYTFLQMLTPTAVSDSEMTLAVNHFSDSASKVIVVVLRQGVSSGAVQVANVLATHPVITPMPTYKIARSATPMKIEIRGKNFGTICTDLSVVFERCL